jgi:septal ring factor EnvC (AmiA/AmiB activator)
MAKKEMTLDDIGSLLQKVAVQSDETSDLLRHVIEHMATKEETATKTDLTEGLAAFREEMATKTELSTGFASLRSELSEIKQQLKELKTTAKNHSGFAKEIDHALARIAAIEKRLGITSP